MLKQREDVWLLITKICKFCHQWLFKLKYEFLAVCLFLIWDFYLYHFAASLAKFLFCILLLEKGKETGLYIKSGLLHMCMYVFLVLISLGTTKLHFLLVIGFFWLFHLPAWIRFFLFIVHWKMRLPCFFNLYNKMI